MITDSPLLPVNELVGNDPCRYRAMHDKHESICKHFDACQNSRQACRSFRDYVVHNRFCGERQPSFYWYASSGLENVPEGHKCCAGCSQIKPLDCFAIANSQGAKKSVCMGCTGDRTIKVRAA